MKSLPASYLARGYFVGFRVFLVGRGFFRGSPNFCPECNFVTSILMGKRLRTKFALNFVNVVLINFHVLLHLAWDIIHVIIHRGGGSYLEVLGGG